MKRSFQVEVILFPHTNNSSSPLETTGRSNQCTYFYFSFAFHRSPSSWLQGTHPLGQTQTLGHLCLPPSLTPSFPPSSAPRIQFRTTFSKSISAPRAPLLQDGAHRHSGTMRSGEGAGRTKPSGVQERALGDGNKNREGRNQRAGTWQVPKVGGGHTSSPRTSRKVKFARLRQQTHAEYWPPLTLKTKANDLHSLSQLSHLHAGCEGPLKKISCACAAAYISEKAGNTDPHVSFYLER